MKHTLFSIIFILLLSTFAQAENKVVTTPVFFRNSQMIHIESIVITEKVTNLHCIIRTLIPETSTVTISSKCYIKGESGKIYNINSSKGVNLSEKVHSEEPVKFVLTFNPLAENETMFDLFLNPDDQTKPELYNVLTYKPDNVHPFKCKIKGRVVGLPECKRVKFHLNSNARLAEMEYIPVINGEFELEKEYNFIEIYNLYPEEENPLKSKGQLSSFYINEGIINVVLNSKESGKENEITGNFEFQNFLPFKLLFGTDSSFYKQYFEIVNEPSGFRSELALYHPEIIAIAKKYKDQVVSLIAQIESTKKDVIKDSLLIELINIQKASDIYSDETKYLITEMEMADKRYLRKVIDYYKENPTVEKLNDLTSKISGLISSYPAVYKNRYWSYTVITSSPFYAPRNVADELLNTYIEVFETVYMPAMSYHPMSIWLLPKISSHNNRLEQAERFFKVCESINYPQVSGHPEEGKNQIIHELKDRSAYEKLEKNIENALQKKDNESIKYIVEFENDYLYKYPEHEITKRIMRMIKMASDEQNPRKWKGIINYTIDPESLKAVFNALEKYK